jgi:hypothetical protein
MQSGKGTANMEKIKSGDAMTRGWLGTVPISGK